MKPLSPTTDPFIQPYLPGLDLIAPFVQHTDEGKTNTVELFDALVIYSGNHARQVPEPGSSKKTRCIEAQKVFRGHTYAVRMAPALITRKNGTETEECLILPSMRENLVEKALRKIAADDLEAMNVTQDNQGQTEVWVGFTMYQLRKMLSEMGHPFKISQLVEALEVMHGSKLRIQGANAVEVGADEGTGIIQRLIWKRKKADDAEGKDYRVWAKLHPFITASIIQKTFRQIDFAKLMRPKNELARWLYTRLSHNYIQAAEDDLTQWMRGEKSAGYHISLSTIIRETGFQYTNLSNALKAVRIALRVLRDQDVLRGPEWSMKGTPQWENFQGWIEEIAYAPSNGGRKAITDVVFRLFPATAVVDDAVKANRTAKVLTLSR